MVSQLDESITGTSKLFYISFNPSSFSHSGPYPPPPSSSSSSSSSSSTSPAPPPTKFFIHHPPDSPVTSSAPIISNPSSTSSTPASSSTICTSQPIPFNYIPTDTDIIAIDSFNRNSSPIIAIAFVKPSTSSKSHSYHLNIYGASFQNTPVDIFSIAADCQPIPLAFIPFLLAHTEIEIDNVKQNVFLICGGDNSVHLFRQKKNTTNFEEEDSLIYFPEFVNFQSRILSLAIKNLANHRIIAAGCQDGTLFFSIYPLADNQEPIFQKILFDGPISSVSFFHTYTEINETDESISNISPSWTLKPLNQDQRDKNIFANLNLLVCPSVDPACVYQVESKGLTSTMSLLNNSDSYDVILCSHVADIDFDGKNEIILGTFAQVLLAYRGDVEHGYELMWKKPLSYPICGIKTLDITKDGLLDYLLLSLFGVHILQGELTAAKGKIFWILENLLKKKPE